MSNRNSSTPSKESQSSRKNRNPSSQRKRRSLAMRRILVVISCALVILFCVLIGIFISRQGSSNPENPTSVVLYKTVELQPSADLNADALVQDNPDMLSITLENMPEKDASGNYPEGEYQVEVLAGGKPAGTVTVKISDNAPAGQPESSDASSEEAGGFQEDGPTYVNGILISNKKHPLPSDFNPGNDPQAESEVQRLISDMQAQGLDVQTTTSGFRDYDYQKQLYDGYVAQYGQEEADRISARPGYSEHQTGLTHDLINTAGELITSEPEASWIREHCAEYGFIVRYPQGKEEITGYDYEPWHLRYVGNPAAQEIMSQGLTLEEYLNVEGGDYADRS